MQKVERLVNLIALLLNTRRPLTVEEVRQTIPGYQQDDYASFKRMFERDKEELRAVGIPIERRFTDVWEVEEGYMIPQDRYYLPELQLSPDEVAALWIASNVVVEEGGEKEEQALLKLALGANVRTDPSSPPWLRARLHLDAPQLQDVLEGVAQRRQVTFRYQAAGQTKETERTVDPYALVHRQGAWYLVGYDHLRDDVRHFKLQRIASSIVFVSRDGPDFEVPDGFGADDLTVSEPWVGREGASVEVAFSPRISWWAEQSLGLESEGTWKGWTRIKIPVTDEESFVSWVIGFGEDAVVRSPARMREAVVERLRAFTGGKAGRR